MNKLSKATSIGIISLTLLNPFSTLAMTKTETIYANIKYDGTVQNTTINTKLSDLEKASIEDYTKLEDIKNINGKEKFTREGERLTWKSTGKDIYYQGKYNNALPITVNVKYYLNDKEVQPSKIKGKKGTVRIEVKLTNSDYNFDYGMYVPYIVNLTTILNNDSNRNISITNGKTISTGTNTVVTALSAPGLYNNIKLDELKDLDKVTITYDTESFEKSDIYFVITPKLLSTIDIEKLNELGSVKQKVNELQNGMNQVDDGAKKLDEGSKQIAAESIKLQESLSILSEGQTTLNTNIQGITSKVEEVTSTLNTINNILIKIYNKDFNLTEEEFNILPENIKEMVISMTSIYEVNYKSIENLENLNASLESIYNLYNLDGKTEEQITKELTEKGLDEQTISLIIKVKRVFETKYEENLELIKELKQKLDELIIGEQGILTTISKYINIVDSSAKELSAGSNSLAEGLQQAYAGSIRLSNALANVSTSTTTLSQGITKINQEGVSQVTNLASRVEDYSEKAKLLVNLSNNYKGFASTNADETVFIYKLSMK